MALFGNSKKTQITTNRSETLGINVGGENAQSVVAGGDVFLQTDTPELIAGLAEINAQSQGDITQLIADQARSLNERERASSVMRLQQAEGDRELLTTLNKQTGARNKAIDRQSERVLASQAAATDALIQASKSEGAQGLDKTADLIRLIILAIGAITGIYVAVNR